MSWIPMDVKLPSVAESLTESQNETLMFSTPVAGVIKTKKTTGISRNRRRSSKKIYHWGAIQGTAILGLGKNDWDDNCRLCQRIPAILYEYLYHKCGNFRICAECYFSNKNSKVNCTSCKEDFVIKK